MSAVWIYLTAANREEAVTISRALVEEHLAACTNVLGESRSFYWWEGKVQDEPETVVVLKTREELVDRLVARVKKMHSYKCPCVIALPIQGGNVEYLAWIEAVTRGKPA